MIAKGQSASSHKVELQICRFYASHCEIGISVSSIIKAKDISISSYCFQGIGVLSNVKNPKYNMQI
jgi:hypothetical protein